ncbi:MAG: ComF family protein [Fidelibacterota bacterium]
MKISPIKEKASDILHILLDFVYPPFCEVCNNCLLDNEKIVCNKCWNALEIIKSPPENLSSFSNSCFSDIFILYKFDETLQKIVHIMKYRYKKSIAVEMGRRMGNSILSERNMDEWNYIVPVPLHRDRYRERGFNQSELISMGVSEVLGIPVLKDVLVRIRNTKSQTKLNVEERVSNVENAFKVVKRDKIVESNIILVDDIYTTGSTMNSCSKALRLSGVNKILVLAAGIPVDSKLS